LFGNNKTAMLCGAIRGKRRQEWKGEEEMAVKMW